MFERIESAWSSFGETSPHWSVITDDRFTPEQIDQNLADFDASGDSDATRVATLLARHGVDKPDRVLDFGCGVGRITQALAKAYPRVVGADVSRGHLVEAERRQLANASFAHIRKLSDISALGSFDLIVSLIVLQHNPPPVMMDILERLLASLNPGGVAIFQIPTFALGYWFEAKAYLAAEQPQMEVHALPQATIFAIAAQQGCRILEVREDLSLADMAAVSQIFAVQRM